MKRSLYKLNTNKLIENYNRLMNVTHNIQEVGIDEDAQLTLAEGRGMTFGLGFVKEAVPMHPDDAELDDVSGLNIPGITDREPRMVSDIGSTWKLPKEVANDLSIFLMEYYKNNSDGNSNVDSGAIALENMLGSIRDVLDEVEKTIGVKIS